MRASFEQAAAGRSSDRPSGNDGSIHAAGCPSGPAQPLLRYAPAFVLLAIVVADALQFADTDLWGHVRFGQIVLRTGHLIHQEIFSYTAAGRPWINHEWLSEVLMAFAYNAMGVAGLKLFKFLGAAAVMVLVSAGEADMGAAPDVQFAVLLAVAFGLQLQIQFRPQLFDYIFLSALLAMFARARRDRGIAPILLAVPMMVLWANLHGGFFIGIVVLGLYSGVVGLQDLWEGRGWSYGLRLGLLTLVCALVTLINPYGFGEWRIVAHTLGNPYTMGVDSEFQSFFHVLSSLHRQDAPLLPFLIALGVMAAMPVSFALAPRWDDLPQLAIAALMVGLALYSVRNMAFAVIACAAPIAYHLDLALKHRARPRATPQASPEAAGAGLAPGKASDATSRDMLAPGIGRQRRASPLAQVIAVAAAVAISLQMGLFSSRLRDFTEYPVGAVRFMRRHDLSGRILNRFIWGSYIIWHEAPRSKVFIDGRFEMVYPLKVQHDYLEFLRGGSEAAKVLADYPHDFVLVKTDSPRFRFMTGQTGWKLVYRDPVAALFARAGSPATHIAGVPVMAKKAPPSMFP